MALKIYNSLSQTKEEFVPLNPGHASFYICGPTVYSESHLGHCKTYVSFDVILRYLKFAGYQTFYVQNITDVGHLLGDDEADATGEDKILKRARETQMEPMAVAEYYTRSFFRGMDQLGVQRADISPRATGHIPEQLEAIEALIERGHAYEAGGSVYFEVSSFPEYGCLSKRDTSELLCGTREEVRGEKRHPHDFALWKRAEPNHLMRWRDPWSGWGYPGWHTECVVMSSKYLGKIFDIHGGGMDLKFPHHECEIAQARCLGQDFARYWMHTNMLTINGQKMSRSLKNYITLEEAFQQYPPLVLRYFAVSGHYRSVTDYSAEALQSAKASLRRLHQVTLALRQKRPPQAEPSHQYFQDFRRRFCEAMEDDFSTPQALAVLFELTHEVNTQLHQKTLSPEALVDAEHLFSILGGQVLGLIPEDLAASNEAQNHLLNEVMKVVIDLRARFRHSKDYASADYLRDRLQTIGLQLKDSKEGTMWEWNNED